MNISSETLEQLNELYYFNLSDNNLNEVPANKATEIHIGWEKNAECYIGVNLKTPKKKEVTLGWILNKINADITYYNFAEKFKTLISNNGMSVYPTSYGIGVSVIFNFRENINKYQTEIENILNEKQIDYKTEYSEAGWVFRYKISKSKENINKLI